MDGSGCMSTPEMRMALKEAGTMTFDLHSNFKFLMKEQQVDLFVIVTQDSLWMTAFIRIWLHAMETQTWRLTLITLCPVWCAWRWCSVRTVHFFLIGCFKGLYYRIQLCSFFIYIIVWLEVCWPHCWSLYYILSELKLHFFFFTFN